MDGVTSTFALTVINQVVLTSQMGKMLFLMSVMVLVGSSLQSIKSPSFSPGPGVLKTCARLYHPETGIQLELQSLPEKIPVGAGGSGGLSSFRVMEGCVLTLWGGAHSRSFPSGAYPNITVGGSSAFHCSCEAEEDLLPIRERYEKFVKQHIDNSRRKSNDKGYCERMKKKWPKGKPENTLIHASKNKIKAVCGSAGTHFTENVKANNIYKSKKRFNITCCKLNKKNHYKTPSVQNKFIFIACDEDKDKKGLKLPVHLESLTCTYKPLNRSIPATF